VSVTTDQRGFTAAVSSIVPAGDPRSQSFEVLVKAPKVDGLLASGNTVDVELPLGEPRRSLAVPRDALIIRAEGLYIYRVDGKQRAERLRIESGVADGDWIAVSGAGLKDGDQVVVRGGETLRGGERLQIVGLYEETPPVPVAPGR
jgi:multidrug efflux pump subunit AcrA (membrane-fusion protein)